jgi:hypothetical protein
MNEDRRFSFEKKKDMKEGRCIVYVLYFFYAVEPLHTNIMSWLYPVDPPILHLRTHSRASSPTLLMKHTHNEVVTNG